MTTLRIFDPTYIFRAEPAADARPAETRTQTVIVLETVGTFAGVEGPQPVFLRLDAAPDALFSGTPDGYSGEIARVRAFRGSEAAALAEDPSALLYDIEGVEGLTLDAYLRAEDPLAADRALFSGSDTIVTEGGSLRLASNVLVLTQDLVQDPEAPADRIVGPNELDTLGIEAPSLEVVGLEDAAGAVRLFERAAPGSAALVPLTEIAGIERLAFDDTPPDGSVALAAFLDRAPLAVAPGGPDPETAGPLPADGSSVDLYDLLLGTALSFRVDPATLPDAPATALELGRVDTDATLGAVRIDRAAASLVYTATPEPFAGLGEGEAATDRFLYRVTDGVRASAFAPVEIAVTGVNDPVRLAPGLSVLAGEIVEGGEPVAAGAIRFRDADLTDTHSVVELAAAEEVPGGSFDPGTAGPTDDPALRETLWSFEIPGERLERLAEGQSATNEYVVEITDMAPLAPGSTTRTSETATVTITFLGRNDAPAIDAGATDTARGVAEIVKDAEIAGDPLLTTEPAVLTFTDPDLIDLHSASVRPLTPEAVGAFEIDQPVRIGGPDENRAEVAWRFSVPDSAIGFLGEGATLTQSYDIVVTESSIPEAARETASQTVTVTITGANDAPVCVDDTGMVVEDGPAIAIDVLANDSDPDAGDTLAIAGIDTAGTRGSVTLGEDGRIAYDPAGAFESLAEGETATDVVTYRAVDPFGCECAASLTVTVVGTNDAPEIVLGGDGPVSDLMGEVPRELLGMEALAFDDMGEVVFRDVDLSDTHTASATPLGEGFLGAFEILDPTSTPTTEGGVVSWRFETDEETLRTLGAEVVVQDYLVTVTDPFGAMAAATVSITLNGLEPGNGNGGMNACPEPMADAETVSALSGPVPIDVLANDTDPDGDPLILIPDPIELQRGVARVEGNRIVFDPNGDFDTLGAGQSETVVIGYTVTDGVGAPEGADLTDPALDICRERGLLTVTVTGSNQCPVVVDDSVSIAANADPVALPVLANDSDPDGDTLTIVALSGDTLGSVSLAGDRIRYDPGSAFLGLGEGETVVETITYAVSDGNGCTELGTLTVTVTGVNDCPLADDDMATVAADGDAVLIPVLDNDSDLDGDTLSIVEVSGDTAGAVTLFGDRIRYAPGDAFRELRVGESVTEIVTYTVSDGICTDTATLRIRVEGTNVCPEPEDDAAALLFDTGEISIPVLANDTDANGDPLEIVAVAQPAVGTAEIVGDRIVYSVGDIEAYAFGEDLTATEVFEYTVTDGRGCEETAQVSVTVGLEVFDIDVIDAIAAFDEIAAIDSLLVFDSGPSLNAVDGPLFASSAPAMTTVWEGFASGGLLGAGPGFDSVDYALARAALAIELAPGGAIEVAGPEGQAETLLGVERVAVADGALRFDLGADAPTLHRLYAAAFGRTPDEGGLVYWDGERAGGAEILEIADAFVASPEFEDRFGGAAPEPEAFVDALYGNIYARPADPGGRDFWTGELADGLSRAEMLLAFADSAENRALTAADTEDGLWVTG